MFSSNNSQVSNGAVFVEDIFSTYLYTGTTSAQTITNGIDLSTKGGLVWIKSRTDGAIQHRLMDTLRGASYRLASNSTAAQSQDTQGLTSFNTNGFSLGTSDEVNYSGNFASWTFRKQPKFFDVVTFSGTGSARTIAHNLGSVPGCIIVKNLDSATNWAVYHRSLGGTYITRLNRDWASDTGYENWADTDPTSTVFTVGNGNATNGSGYNYVAYVFAHNAGGFGLTGTDNVISCSSFTTDGSGNATVDLGYEPQWLLVKANASGNDWYMYDNMRGLSYSNYVYLSPNLSAAEGNIAADYLVPTATGFKTKSFAGSTTYIYMAIRRGPMKVPTSGTSVFSNNLETSSTNPQTLTTGFPVDLSINTLKNVNSTIRYVLDRLRGSSVSSGVFLQTNGTNAETATSGLGFQNNTGLDDNGWWNTNGAIFWSFGRAPSFFDEVCYTGTGTAQNITHNLGVVPELWIVKKRSSGTNRPWRVGTGNGTTYMALNSVDASTSSSDPWNNTAPTASVFTVGIENATNESSATFVAYLFATCAGVSKVGSYTGNGSTQTINCGFTGGARFVLIKRTDSTGDWYVYDTARGMTTLTDPYLLLNSTAAESATLGSVTTVSTGFALNAGILAAINTNGASYIFLAIA